MFVRNVISKPIGPIVYEGFTFIIPPGVSAIYGLAGKYFTEVIYRIESRNPKPPIYVEGRNVGGDGGAPLPPLIAAHKTDRAEWKKKWNGQFAQVTRFQVDPSRLPARDFLLELAERRGMDANTVTKFRSDSRIDNEEIVKAINALLVPDEIRFPAEDMEESEKSEDT